MSTEKWCYSFNGENFEGTFDSKQQAIDEGMHYVNEDNEESLYVGQIKDIGIGVNVNWLLDQLGDDAYEQVGEYAEDFLRNVKREHQFELEDRLNKILHEWLEEYNYKPNFWTVDNVEKIK